MSFRDICNICFIKKVKRAKNDLLVLPAVNKQQGKTWNYIIIVCDDEYNGVYKWNPEIISTLRIWNNGSKPCYILKFSQLIKIKDLEDIDPHLPLGGYISRIMAKIRGELDAR